VISVFCEVVEEEVLKPPPRNAVPKPPLKPPLLVELLEKLLREEVFSCVFVCVSGGATKPGARLVPCGTDVFLEGRPAPRNYVFSKIPLLTGIEMERPGRSSCGNCSCKLPEKCYTGLSVIEHDFCL